MFLFIGFFSFVQNIKRRNSFLCVVKQCHVEIPTNPRSVALVLQPKVHKLRVCSCLFRR